MRLPGKVVFITDADSDSGKAIIRRLADEGADFLLNSTSGGEEIRPFLNLCESIGSKTKVVHTDLCQSAEVSGMLDEAAQELGPVDVLVHNRDRILPASVETCDEAAFLSVMGANAKSAFICTQAVGRQMAARRSGKIVFISSIHADKPTGASFVYSVSKAAQNMLAKEAALELGRYGVCVNSISMGPVEGDDERFKSEISALYDSYRYKVPNAVLGSYDDLADCVLYLASGEAGYVNGADIRLDGGFLLHYMDHKMKKNQPSGGASP